MISATVKYAYNPRQGNRSNGAHHLVLDERLDSGRFHYEGNDSRADCKRCVELAVRHGVTEVPVPR